MHRLFVALRPPAEIRNLLTTAMSGVPHARWQNDDQIHLTIRYIGEVERPVAEDIALALAQVSGRAPTIAISGVGAFDDRGRVDTLWAGVAPQDSLKLLHRKADQVLIRMGLKPDRRAYLPHITLARLPRGANVAPMVERWRADHAMLSSDAFRIGRIGLYESHWARDGSIYEEIAGWPLD